jgi:hypothetical protein
MSIDINMQIACVRREIGMRKKVYPRWIQSGRMTPEESERQILTMEAVLATLERVRDEQMAKTAPELPL